VVNRGLIALRNRGFSASESQGQVLDSLKESPIQKECDAKIDQTLAEIQQILGIEINKEANE